MLAPFSGPNFYGVLVLRGFVAMLFFFHSRLAAESSFKGQSGYMGARKAPFGASFGRKLFPWVLTTIFLELHFAQMRASEGLLIVIFDLRCYASIRLLISSHMLLRALLLLCCSRAVLQFFLSVSHCHCFRH